MSDCQPLYHNLASDDWRALELFAARYFGVEPIRVVATPDGRPDPAVVGRLRDELAGRDALYTLTADGVLSVIPAAVDGLPMMHTAASGGESVVAAGHLTVAADGSVVGWSNSSGHYRPDADVSLGKVTRLLRAAGLLAAPAGPG